MFSLHHHPFRGRVGVAVGYPSLKFHLAFREELDRQAVLDGPLGLAFPAKMGDERAIDLHTSGETRLNQARRQALGKGRAVQTGPGDQHGGEQDGSDHWGQAGRVCP